MKYPTLTDAERLNTFSRPPGKLRMVLDTDTYNEIDDQFALTYALRSKESLQVQAIYAAPFFNSNAASPKDGMEKSYGEIVRLLDLLDHPSQDFVFRGSTTYLDNRDQPERSAAALDIIARAENASPEEPLWIAAIGAITNVASAILIEPEIIRNIAIVWLAGNAHHWPHNKEFNMCQDLKASRLVLDCGVSLVRVPCYPVASHLHTTVPEIERYLQDSGLVGEYLSDIFKSYQREHFAWSKPLWDMAAIAYLINEEWTPAKIVHSPILTDQLTWSFDSTRHLMREVMFVQRDAIFRDFFNKAISK